MSDIKVFTLPAKGNPTNLRAIAEALPAPLIEELMDLADGNYGGMTVLTQLAKAKRQDVIDEIRKRDLRGDQIWVGFKTGCDCNLDAFAAAVLSWDPKVIKAINSRCERKVAG